MLERYAFCIHFVDPNSDYALLAGRCMKVLHGYLKRNNISHIGTFFPYWSETSIGKGIAFFSRSSAHLLDFSRQHYFIKMTNIGKFHLSRAIAIPDQTREVRYVRNQRIDKLRPGGFRRGVRRCKNRAEKAGKTYQTKTRKNNEQLVPFFHNVPMTSSNNPEKVFLIRVQQEIVDVPVVGDFGSYGLANQSDKRATVPYFENTLFL